MAATSEWLITPSQVWAQVPGELQQRTVSFMAHLARNLVVASGTQASEEEGDAEASAGLQAPA